MVTYVVHGGLHAWRHLCNEDFPMDHTKQDIILTEIISLAPVKDKEVRSLLNRIEELRDKHDSMYSSSATLNMKLKTRLGKAKLNT